MTQWVTASEGGRDRGPKAIARAWFETTTGPTRFFRNGVAPGDQAPGVTFAMMVVLLEELTRFVLVDDAYPVVAGDTLLSGVLWLGIAVVIVVPIALHLLAALQTLLLLPFAPDRGGVSETVQVYGYATAPCVFAGVPSPALRAVVGLYAFGLLAIGLATVHRTSVVRASVLGFVPGVLGYGYGFRALDGIFAILRSWYII